RKARARAIPLRLSLIRLRTNPIRYYAMLIRVLAAPVPGHRRDAARTAEPVTFGVPLPQGLLRDPSNWTIKADRAGGPSWPTQTRVLDRWSDGSARWVLVDARVDVDPGGHGAYEIDTDGAKGSVGSVTCD